MAKETSVESGVDKVAPRRKRPTPERLRYQYKHYACINPACTSLDHDAEYVRLDLYESLRRRNTKLVEALESITKPPMVLEGDSAIDVASWFVEQARAALASVKDKNNE